jgi:hypothetical protein
MQLRLIIGRYELTNVLLVASSDRLLLIGSLKEWFRLTNLGLPH